MRRAARPRWWYGGWCKIKSIKTGGGLKCDDLDFIVTKSIPGKRAPTASRKLLLMAGQPTKFCSSANFEPPPHLLLPNLLLGLLPAPGHTQKSDSYRVIGDVQGLAENAKVYQINGGELRAIDSAAVRQDHLVLTSHRSHAAQPLHAGVSARGRRLPTDVPAANAALVAVVFWPYPAGPVAERNDHAER